MVFDNSPEMCHLLLTHIHNIMVVDRNEICLDLFYQFIKKMIPHANVVTDRSGKETLQEITRDIYTAPIAFDPSNSISDQRSVESSHCGFVIIIAEERLHSQVYNDFAKEKRIS